MNNQDRGDTDEKQRRHKAFINSKYAEYRLVYFWSLDFCLGSPDSKGREDGLSAIGTAADLKRSPHQLLLLMSLLQLFTVNYFLQSNNI